MAKKRIEEDAKQQPEVPVRFRELLGHTAQVRFLERSIARGVLPQTLLLTGPEGVGKTTLARMVAAALECEEGSGESCGSCGPCRKVARGLHPDVREVRPEGLTKSGRERTEVVVEQVRTGVLDPLVLPPYEGRKLVFLIEPAESLNPESQNALLKSLEEPPPFAQFLLVSSNAAGLLPTVRSRCHEVALAPVSEPTMQLALERSAIPRQEWGLAAASAAGSPGKLLRFDRKASEFRRETLLALMRDGLDLGAYPDLSPGLEKLSKESPREICAMAAGLVRDSIRLANQAPPRLHADVAEALLQAASRRGPDGLQRLADRLAEAPGRLVYNVNPRLLWENVFLVP